MAQPRGYFGIGVEGVSKPMNVGALMRTAHAFGASFVFTLGAVYARDDFPAGGRVAGPALIVEAGTSTLVGPAFEAALDGGGALVLTRRP